MVVPIDPRIEIRLRVVQVKRQHLLQADHLPDLGDRGVPALGRADVVAGGEEVRGVQANTEPLRLLDAPENIGEVADAVSKAGALPGGVLERDSHRRFFRGTKDAIERLGDALHAPVVALAKVRAGMQHEERHAERCGNLDLPRERLDRLVAVVAVRPGEVNEIAGVAKHRSYVALGQLGPESFSVFRLWGLAEPLHVAFDENLCALAVNRAGSLDGLPGTASGGHMGTKFHTDAGKLAQATAEHDTHVPSRKAPIAHAECAWPSAGEFLLSAGQASAPIYDLPNPRLTFC